MNHHRQTKDSQTHLFVVLYLKQQFRVVLALAVATNEDVLAAIDTSRKDFLKSVQPCLFCTCWHHRQMRPRSCTTNRLKSWNHGQQIQDISSGTALARKRIPRVWKSDCAPTQRRADEGVSEQHSGVCHSVGPWTFSVEDSWCNCVPSIPLCVLYV